MRGRFFDADGKSSPQKTKSPLNGGPMMVMNPAVKKTKKSPSLRIIGPSNGRV